jgi:hypothetical protein
MRFMPRYTSQQALKEKIHAYMFVYSMRSPSFKLHLRVTMGRIHS